MSGSLSQNPPNAGRSITNAASDWLWAVCAIMILATLGMALWSFSRPRGTRFFHNIATIILATSALAYFSMASDLGATPITTEFGVRTTRQIWYVRWIQYFINFPLLLILLQFATGLSLSDILTTAFFGCFVVICALVGALVTSSYKWGYFTFGLFALFWIWASLLHHGRRSSFAAGAGVRTGYTRGAGFVALLTALYPVAWGLSEGSNKISPTAEMIFYGILDLILGPLFLYYFIFGLRGVDYGTFGFHSGKYSDGPYGANGGGVGYGAGGGHLGAGGRGPGMASNAAPGATTGATVGNGATRV